MADESRALTIGEGRGGVEEWRAYVRRNPKPDPWWPLKWEKIGGFSDITRTHPTAFGVWMEGDGTYTVAIKAEAKRRGDAGWRHVVDGTGAREVKRRNIPDLFTLRTYLISLAKDPNCP